MSEGLLASLWMAAALLVFFDEEFEGAVEVAVDAARGLLSSLRGGFG